MPFGVKLIDPINAVAKASSLSSKNYNFLFFSLFFIFFKVVFAHSDVSALFSHKSVFSSQGEKYVLLPPSSTPPNKRLQGLIKIYIANSKRTRKTLSRHSLRRL